MQPKCRLAYRRRTNTYAKDVNGLQRALTERAFGTQLGKTALGIKQKHNACNGIGVVSSIC